MFTPRAKILGVTAVGVIIIGGLSYAQYTTAKQVAQLTSQSPIVVTKTVVVTPTVVPTATPSASLRTRISTPASATKGAVTK